MQLRAPTVGWKKKTKYSLLTNDSNWCRTISEGTPHHPPRLRWCRRSSLPPLPSDVQYAFFIHVKNVTFDLASVQFRIVIIDECTPQGPPVHFTTSFRFPRLAFFFFGSFDCWIGIFATLSLPVLHCTAYSAVYEKIIHAWRCIKLCSFYEPIFEEYTLFFLLYCYAWQFGLCILNQK